MRRLLLAMLVVLLPGCYHATVETGKAPSPETVENKWASGWIYGLVPPSTVQTMQECPSGVARVETQLSFPNQLVGFLTLGIYTPMEIVATCAADGGMEEEELVESREELREALDRGAPFHVRLEQAM